MDGPFNPSKATGLTLQNSPDPYAKIAVVGMFGQKNRTGMIFTTIAPVLLSMTLTGKMTVLGNPYRRIRLSTRCTFAVLPAIPPLG